MRELDEWQSSKVRGRIADLGAKASDFWTAVTSAWLARVADQTNFPILNWEHQWRAGDHSISVKSNYLPLIVDTAGNPTLGELIERIENDRYLVMQSPPELLPNPDTYCPVYVACSEITAEGKLSGEVDTGNAPVQPPETVSVAIDVLEAGHSWPLQIRLGFNGGVFTPEEQEQAALQYMRVLSAMLSQQSRIESIEIVTPEEANWLRGPEPARDCEHILDQFARWVAANPHVTAVQASSRSLTFLELDTLSRRFAAAMLEAGLQPGDRVAVCVRRAPELVASMLGIFLAGGTYVPIDAANPMARKQRIIEDAESAMVIADVDAREDLPQDRLVLRVEDELPPPIKGPGAREQAGYMIYTSGSTGAPKGVLLHHNGLANQLASMQARIGFESSDRLLAVTTTSFDASIFELCFPLWCGGRVELVSDQKRRDPNYIAKRLDQGEITTMFATPATWHMLIANGWLGRSPNFQVITGGEALSRSLANELLARADKVWNIYGPTETTVCSTVAEVSAGSEVVPLGEPLAHTTLRVLNEGLQVVPRGVAGELCIGGAGVGDGYFNRPELTAASFIEDPYDAGQRLYKSGDIVRLSADNRLIYLGRKDNQVKLRGYRIDLGEVEAALEALPEIQQAAVVMPGQSIEARYLHAFVIAQRELDQADTARKLSELIPGYMIPKVITRVPELPINSNGKVARQALIDQAASTRVANQTIEELPQSDLEVKVAQIWREILGVETARDCNFFDAGGNSLSAVHLLSALEESTGAQVTFREFYDNPSIIGLAEYIENTTGDIGPDRPVQLNDCRDESAPALFCVDGVHLYQSLARSLQDDLPVYGMYAQPDQQMAANVIAGKKVDEFPSPRELAAQYETMLREFQPHGPYRLAGFSFGGMVAYELAQSLRRGGEEVDALILLDTPLLRSIQKSRGWAQLANHKARISLQKSGIKAISQDPLDVCRVLAADRYEEEEVAPYDNPALLCRATGESETRQESEPSLGWSQYVDELTIADCSGNHRGMLEKHHDEVASAIRDFLRS